MSRPLTQRGLARVREFVGKWHGSDANRSPTCAERALIEEALVDYLAAESMVATSTEASVQEAIAALQQLCPIPGNEVAAIVARCLDDLRLRLDNQEDDNLIMREHLVTLSEQNRRLRAAAHPISSEK